MSAVLNALFDMTLALVLSWVGIAVEPKAPPASAPSQHEQQACEGSGSASICLSVTSRSTSAGFSTKTCASAQ